jgi:hypothetical protein
MTTLEELAVNKVGTVSCVCKSLKLLVISNNSQFDKLNPNIEKLEKLEILGLCNTIIEKLPEEIKIMAKL